MTATTALRLNARLRGAYGAVALVAPTALPKAARLPPPDPDARYLGALFGGRDLSVAWVTKELLRRGREQDALMLAISCEATDLFAWVTEAKRRDGMRGAVAVGAVFSAVGLLTCATAAVHLRRR